MNFEETKENPWLKSFGTVHELEQAMTAFNGVTFQKTEPFGSASIALGSDRRFYVIGGDTHIMLEGSYETWKEAVEHARTIANTVE